MSPPVTSKPQKSRSNSETHKGQAQGVNGFQQFEVVSDPSDHHFYDNGGSSREAQKKIMQEWRILREHLPDSIFVRAYEDRIDLLRATIVGAKGTPYHDGLYVFDVAFPRDYPALPPKVHYWSFWMGINPNLYSNGLICLSLLNTWTGCNKSEMWNPKESTVLQVLLSVQALVLNDRPYFNEPLLPRYGKPTDSGFFGWRSKAYNEEVFIMSCKTMLFLLGKPPRNLEDLVIQHFRERAPVILSACNAYVTRRARIGYYGCDGSSSVAPPPVASVSMSFQQSMTDLYSKMVVAFRQAGASLGPEFEQLEQESKAQEEKTSGFIKCYGPLVLLTIVMVLMPFFINFLADC